MPSPRSPVVIPADPGLEPGESRDPSSLPGGSPLRAAPPSNPASNLVPRSHVERGVSDLAASRAFYVDCLGYIVSDEDKDALYLRGVEERNHHSVVLRKSNDIAALAIGFKVASEEDLDKAAEWLSARGLPVSLPP